MDAKIPKDYVPYAVIATNGVNVLMTFVAVCERLLLSLSLYSSILNFTRVVT